MARNGPPADDAPHLLVVDDDRRIRVLLSRYLQENSYRVTTAESAADARLKMQDLTFDLIILDVMMPGENGFEFTRSIRVTNPIPILMLTALNNVNDRLIGLELGVDDYLTKPFEPRELLLRIGSVLRRTAAPPPQAEAAAPDAVTFGPFTFKRARGELRQGEELIRITDRERDILNALTERIGSTVPREALINAESASNERTVDVQVNRLRRKLEADPANPQYLITVRGAGYRLQAEA